MNLPNTLLLDPVTGNAAAYNAIHRKITFQASAALVAYAQAQGFGHAPWDPSKHSSNGEWHPLPPWATEETLKRCVLYRLRSGFATEAELMAMPHA